MKSKLNVLSGLCLTCLGIWSASTAFGQKVETVLQLGHSADIRAVSFSPNGKYIATAGKDNNVKLWDEATGKLIRTFVGHDDGVNDICFSPDGRNLITASDDGTVQSWEAATGKKIKTFNSNDKVAAVSFSPDGKYIVTGSLDKKNAIVLWQAAAGNFIRTYRTIYETRRDTASTETFHHKINSISFSSNGKTFVSGGRDGTAKIWSISEAEANRTFGKPRYDELLAKYQGVYSASFSPDGKWIAAGDGDTVRIWEAATGKTIRQWRGHDKRVLSVRFSSDGRYLATGSEDKSAKLWLAKTGENVRVFIGHTGTVYSVSFRPDGKYLVTGSQDQTAKLWEVDTGKLIHTFSGQVEEVSCVDFSPDGKYLAMGSSQDTAGIASLWDLTAGQKIRSFRGHGGGIHALRFSPDGSFFVTASADNTAKLWEVATAKEVRTFHGPGKSSRFNPLGIGKALDERRKAISGGHYSDYIDGVTSVNFSPDGKYLVTGAADKTAKLWEVATGLEIRTFKKHSKRVHSVAFSSDGKYLITGSGDSPVLWDVETGKKIRNFGKRFFLFRIINNSIIKIIESILGKSHIDQVESIGISPDGKYLISGSRDETLSL